MNGAPDGSSKTRRSRSCRCNVPQSAAPVPSGVHRLRNLWTVEIPFHFTALGRRCSHQLIAVHGVKRRGFLARAVGFPLPALRWRYQVERSRVFQVWAQLQKSSGELVNGVRTSSSVRGLLHNMSIDTDPQQQAAASPRVLVVRSFLR
jgi:hypothetical protein